MLKKLSMRNKNIFISLIMFIVTYFSYTYSLRTSVEANVWPVIGFAIGFYMAFREKIRIGLLSGILLGGILGRALFINELVYETILFSIIITGIIYLQLLFFKYFMEKTNSLGRIDDSSGLGYILAIVLTAALGALLMSTFHIIYESGVVFGQEFLLHFISESLGITIFGTILLITFYYEEQELPESTGKNVVGVLFILSFIIVAYFLFHPDYTYFTYDKYGFIFVVFFFIAGTVFSYRMLITLSLLFLLMFQWIFVQNSQNIDLSSVILSMNLYLLVLSLLSASVRMILYDLMLQNNELESSKDRLENLMASTNRLFRIKDIDLSSEDSNIRYVKEIFQIALTLYDCYDYASCYIKVDGEPVFIDAYGYDVDILNNSGFNSSNFSWALTKPIHIVTAEKSLELKLGNSYTEYAQQIPEIVESIQFGIFIDDQMYGGLSFDKEKGTERRFAKTDFENFEAFQKLMNSFYEINHLNSQNMTLKNDIVLSLIQTLELYDQYTGGHSEEVALLSREIAQKMKLSEEEIYDIYWAGIVHDIGKVGVASDIINKQGKLTQEEYYAIKEHPVFGAKILDKSEDLHSISKIVKHHHEWWNGNGYPDELKGDKIPLGAQILCVADAVSSMYGTRPYQPSRSTEQILEELQLYSGAQFNPIIAKVMIDLIKEGVLQKIHK